MCVHQNIQEMKQYSSDLTDKQWQVIEKIQNDARKRQYEIRKIWDAIFYIVKSGCQWRMLPRDYAPWELVYYYYRRWKKEGLIEEVMDELVSKVRIKSGRKAYPTVGIIDSQTVKTTAVCGESRGYDAGKKIKGRKRHLVVDTMGLPLSISVHSAAIQDREGAIAVLSDVKDKHHQVIKIIADGGYRGKLIDFVKTNFTWTLEIIKRNTARFQILPKRWIVERTFAWIHNFRRHSKDYEYLIESSIAMLQLAFIRLILNKLLI